MSGSTPARPTRPRVVVVTGASSGIGRACALLLARSGDTVVLAARGAVALEQVAERCRGYGGQVLAVPLDVTATGDVDALADTALRRFGRVDAWVHTAAVMAYGRFEDVPVEVFRRVVEVDLLGAATVARTALRVFRSQPAYPGGPVGTGRRAGHGTLVVGSSLLAHVTAPYMSGYITSKWGLRGLVRVLQQETRDAPGIRICLVAPGSVNTPIYHRAANYVGRPARPPRPVDQPDRVARAVLRCVDRPRRQVSVGVANPVIRFGFAALPGVYDTLVGPLMRVGGLSRRPVEPHDGTVFAPVAAASAARGAWGRVWPAGLAAGATATATAVLGVAAARARRGPGRHSRP